VLQERSFSSREEKLSWQRAEYEAGRMLNPDVITFGRKTEYARAS
jgi:hypothetical protein